MKDPQFAVELFRESFGSGEPETLSVPGRVNLIGEHIDYHNLPVMPMAIQRRIHVAFRKRDDRRIRAVSANYGGMREFEWTHSLSPSPAGDWENYVKAAAQAVAERWGVAAGIDVAVASDLPPAAGLSSSSALLTAMTLALLDANGIRHTFDELMQVLPEGEYFVGTRGGGMDHAAVLASRAGSALLVQFAPVSVRPVHIPDGWSFLIAHSLQEAEKSGAVREQYNSRRVAGTKAREALGFESYAAVIEGRSFEQIVEMADSLPEEEQRHAFVHVAGEAIRVWQAVQALQREDLRGFADLLNAAHASARDLLRISTDALDELVRDAVAAGGVGARLTGAGFGGCAIILCEQSAVGQVRKGLIESFYAGRPGFNPDVHLIHAQPSDGALFV